MIIYLAGAGEEHVSNKQDLNILFSYYDLIDEKTPEFRRNLWKKLNKGEKNDSSKKGYSSRTGKSKTRISK